MGGAQAAPEISQFIAIAWAWFNGTTLYNFLNSYGGPAFWTATIGSLAGAAGGAWGAQRIAERSKRQDELTREMRSTNAALSVCLAIANTWMNLKRQHVRPMKESYDEDCANYAQQGSKYSPKPNFVYLQIPTQPTDTLRKLVFENISITGRPLNLTLQIKQTNDGLDGSLEHRNQMIREVKPIFSQTGQGFEQFYYGAQAKSGHKDEQYPYVMGAIARQLDDGIFFSVLLTKDLAMHGRKLVSDYQKLFPRAPRLRVHKIDFSIPEELGLLPDPKSYPDWETAFVNGEQSSKPDGEKLKPIHKNQVTAKV